MLEPIDLDRSAVPQKGLLNVIIISVLLHLILGAIVMLHRANTPKPLTPRLPAIEAHLVFPLATMQTIEETQPEVPDITTEKSQVFPIDVANEELNEQQVQTNSENEEPEITQQHTEQYRPEQDSSPQPVEAPLSSASDTGPKFDPRALARQHLQRFQQQNNQALAEQQAREYRQRQLSPKIIAPKPEPFQTEDEAFIEKQRVKVNCDNTTAKAMAALSWLGGGMIQCTRAPSLTPYIENRINKGIESQTRKSGTK